MSICYLSIKSSYNILTFFHVVLSNDEYIALSYGLDMHIPNKASTNKIYTEFEMFSQSFLKNISSIPETKSKQIKTKLLSTCDKQRKTVTVLSKRNNIVILKADKGRGVLF